MDDALQSLVFVIAPDFRREFATECRLALQGSYIDAVFAGRYAGADAVDAKVNKIRVDDLPHTIEQKEDEFTVHCTLRPGSVLVLRKRLDGVRAFVAALDGVALECELRALSSVALKLFCATTRAEEHEATGMAPYDFPSANATCCGFDAVAGAVLRADNGGAVAQNLREGPWLAIFMQERI